MGRPTYEGDSDRIDRAFNRVLAAEAQAREQVESCRREAAAILTAAEAQARRIAQRADQRLQRAHRIADAGVERALAELRTTPLEAPSPQLGDDALSRIDRAIATLITEILGPEEVGRA